MTLRTDPAGLLADAGLIEVDVDRSAPKTADFGAFRGWAAEILPETDRFAAEANRESVRRRVREWLFCLSIQDGHVPSAAELAEVTPGCSASSRRGRERAETGPAPERSRYNRFAAARRPGATG